MEKLVKTLSYSKEVILEVESNGNYFTLVSSPYALGYDTLGNQVYKWNFTKNRSKIRRTFYVLWGSSPSLSDRGVTSMLTPKGNPMTQSGAIKKMHQMIRSTKHINFRN
jgi:hypothetical protein